ncbi:rRNA maturation RNase YbeY [Desulfovibrio mangrovi]|uniref:rRNA maturation RNase YbeY n=1 Tax=Desulfovibrio mangrovi TaxID=2976983 RepID=UPI0022467975|nr:rRNA maturation RNase YbeY [Desulfovibrio mangrovi]UZP68072.1 rRNA maturation RNase YbeY [Desulfovibrio mangrovi]
MIQIKKAEGISWLLPLTRSELRLCVETICTAIGHEGASLDLNLVSDAEVAELNRTFLGCDGPTNILSFPSTDADSISDMPAGWHMGWLALSLDTTIREALLYHQDVTEHALRLIAHGTLHLAGYDHSEEMFDLTEKAAASALAALATA